MNHTTVTASHARANLYNILRKASTGVESFEITLRGSDPVIVMSKNEVDAWLETLDVMSNPEEVEGLKGWKKDKSAIPLTQIMQELNIDEKSVRGSSHKKSR